MQLKFSVRFCLMFEFESLFMLQFPSVCYALISLHPWGAFIVLHLMVSISSNSINCSPNNTYPLPGTKKIYVGTVFMFEVFSCSFVTFENRFLNVSMGIKYQHCACLLCILFYIFCIFCVPSYDNY